MRTRLRTLLARFRASPFARDAAAMVVLNVVTKILSILGSAYAARCLGPANLGVSGMVQTLAQQSFLAVHGGFENVVAREIAHDPARTPVATQTMVTARLAGAAVLAALWTAVSLAAYPAVPLWVKLMGVPLLFLSATGINAAFQGLEKLPIQTAIGTATSLMSAAAYFVFFRPGMGVGSDLLVVVGCGLAGWAVSVASFRKFTHTLPWGRIDVRELRFLLSQSWRYWLVGIVSFAYTAFQVPLVGWLLGVREAGIVQAVYVMIAGVDLLYSSINGLMLPRFVAWSREGLGVLRERQAAMVPLFAVAGGGLTVLFWAAAPIATAGLLGPGFEEASGIFRIWAVGRLVVFVGQIYAYGLIALRRDHENFLASLAGAVVSVALSLLLIRPCGLIAVGWIALATESVVVGLCVFYSFRHYRREGS